MAKAAKKMRGGGMAGKTKMAKKKMMRGGMIRKCVVAAWLRWRRRK